MRAGGNRIAFRRVSVRPEMQQRPNFFTLPAPVRGWILSENPAFMTPGGAMALDNFFPETDRLRVRGGSQEWADTGSGDPIISGFKYVAGANYRMFFGTEDTLWDSTFSGTPTTIATGRLSGNYSAAQLSNEGGDWMIVVNSGGDYPLRFNGTTWEDLDPAGTPTNPITGPAGPVEDGGGLSFVWKYKNRLYFLQGGTMNMWYLPLEAVGGPLSLVPLSGSAKKGGFLLWGATWSLDAGDGLDDKLVVCTSEGEILVFTGSNPDDPNDWRQEGRYEIAKPMGMNATLNVGGDIIIATVDGITPLSQAISRDRQGLELVSLTRYIDSFWKRMASERDDWPWMMTKWDEKGALFVTLPGGSEGARYCLVANLKTGAWARYVGWDATCFVPLQSNFFFGTQDGRIIQAEVTGTDEGSIYNCLYVGNWEHFGNKTAQVTWGQGRVTYSVRPGEPFAPQLSAAIDYNIVLPAYPDAPPDPGPIDDVWDEGLWDEALWDASSSALISHTANTGWVSVGVTGYAFAPIIQCSIEQTTRPTGSLISIDVIADQLAVAV